MSNKVTTTTPKPDGKHALIPKLRFPEFRDAAGWEVGVLEDTLSSLSNGVSLEQSSENSGYRVTRIETISAGTIDLEKVGFVTTPQDLSAYKLRVGEILLSNINSLAHIGKSVFVDRDYDLYHGMNLLRLVVNGSEHDPKFIFHIINTNEIRTSIRERANKAVNQASINQTELGKTELALPRLPEQQKIAACLSSVDELMAAQARKLDALKTHKKALMQQLFPREGETQPRLRFPEFQNAGEWEEESFGKVLKINSGKGFNASEYSSTGIRLLQIENVGYGVTKWNENTIYLPEAYVAQYPDLVLRDGDIVLALNRPVTNDELKIAKIQKNEAIAILYQRVGRLEVLNGRLRKDFAFQLCRQFIKEFVINKSVGSDQPFISLKDLYAQNILLPSPPEQQRIADCLTTVDDLIAAQTQKLAALKTHKQALMQQLFPSPAEVEA